MLEMKEASMESFDTPVTKILVVGVGGAGGNAVNRMISDGESGADYLVVNTDRQVLFSSQAQKLLIGEQVTGGKGAGGNPEIGRQAAEENIEDIRIALTGYDMVFVTAGMGGGTGTGAAPVVARVAMELGILTVAVVTTPFGFEGRRKMKSALAGIERLSENVDSMVIVANQRLLGLCDARTTVPEAFRMADDILRQGVKGISDLIMRPGIVNADFNDVCSIMRNQGFAHMGIGRASGDDMGVKAAELAVTSPLLDTTINGAKSVLVNVSGGPTSSMLDYQAAMDYISDLADEDANIIIGYLIDDNMGEELQVTVIATGFEGARPQSADRPVVAAPKETEVHSPFSFGEEKTAAVPAANTETAATPADEGSLDIPSFLLQRK